MTLALIRDLGKGIAQDHARRLAAAVRAQLGEGSDVRVEGTGVVIGPAGTAREYGTLETPAQPFIAAAIKSLGGGG